MNTTPRKAAVLLSALAVIGMGGVTVACSSPQNERPAETSVTTPPVSTTEKAIRTNVTRAPMSMAPQGGGAANPAVPCGFGPSGGGPCANNG